LRGHCGDGGSRSGAVSEAEGEKTSGADGGRMAEEQCQCRGGGSGGGGCAQSSSRAVRDR
jgi:hypothetical protein